MRKIRYALLLFASALVTCAMIRDIHALTFANPGLYYHGYDDTVPIRLSDGETITVHIYK